MEFFGHVVSRDGVHTDECKTAKIVKWQIPIFKKELQQFFGLANYYRRFVQDFSNIARLLHWLTEKMGRVDWIAECKLPFEYLCNWLVNAPILAFPDHSQVFIVDTDASAAGIGAVLSQEQDDGAETIIANASKQLTTPEYNYCDTQQELLAVFTFIQQFRPYLLGRQFILRTNHGSLTWLSDL